MASRWPGTRAPGIFRGRGDGVDDDAGVVEGSNRVAIDQTVSPGPHHVGLDGLGLGPAGDADRVGDRAGEDTDDPIAAQSATSRRAEHVFDPWQHTVRTGVRCQGRNRTYVCIPFRRVLPSAKFTKPTEAGGYAPCLTSLRGSNGSSTSSRRPSGSADIPPPSGRSARPSGSPRPRQVHAQLANLERKGLLHKDPRKPRAMTLSDDRRAEGVRSRSSAVSLPAARTRDEHVEDRSWCRRSSRATTVTSLSGSPASRWSARGSSTATSWSSGASVGARRRHRGRAASPAPRRTRLR